MSTRPGSCKFMTVEKKPSKHAIHIWVTATIPRLQHDLQWSHLSRGQKWSLLNRDTLPRKTINHESDGINAILHLLTSPAIPNRAINLAIARPTNHETFACGADRCLDSLPERFTAKELRQVTSEILPWQAGAPAIGQTRCPMASRG
jgi:hypothetical protein